MVKKFINNRIDQTSSLLGLDIPYFLKGGFWLFSANLISIVGGIYLSSVFSRVWPKDVYGQFSFLTSIVALLGITSLTGMGEAVFQGSIENRDGVYKNALKKVFIVSILVLFILVAGAFYFFLRNNSNLGYSVLAASLAFPFYSLGSLAIAFIKGKKNFRLSSILTLGSNIFSVIVTAAALIKFGSLIGVAIASFWSTAIANIFVTFKAIKRVRNRRTDERLLKYGVFMSFTNLIWLGLDYADRFFIPLLLSFDKNAIYSFAILLPTQIQNFFKMFTTLGQPKISKIKDSEIKKALIKKGAILGALILLIVITYIVSAPYIFKFLYPDYTESIFPTQLYALTLLYYPNTLFGSYLTKKRLIKESVAGTIIYAFLSFGSLLLFIYLWGLIGAVISKIFSRVLTVAITQFIFFRELRRNTSVQSSDL